MSDFNPLHVINVCSSDQLPGIVLIFMKDGSVEKLPASEAASLAQHLETVSTALQKAAEGSGEVDTDEHMKFKIEDKVRVIRNYDERGHQPGASGVIIHIDRDSDAADDRCGPPYHVMFEGPNALDYLDEFFYPEELELIP